MAAALDRSADRPIREAGQDRLGLGPFVEGLARALLADDRRRARGVVIGLEGPWGSGKSSILNLVAQQLSKVSEDGDKSPKPEPVVVRFDPWLISGREDLIASFLRALVDAIDPVGRERARIGGLVSRLARYGEMVAPAAGFLGGAVGAAVGGAMKALAQATAPTGNPFELRQAVAEALAEFDRPIVVLVDELGRVEDAEVRTMAQLVRSVVDFPSISYLLAYDPQRVAEALGGGGSAEARRRGEAYLEKIVQLRVPVPAPSPGKLLALLAQDVWDLLRATPIARYVDGDRLRFVLGLAGGSKVGDEPLIGTLRDVHRVLGIFAVLEPMLRWEIDPADLLGWSILLAKRPADVEALRGSLPFLYVENMDDFLGFREEDKLLLRGDRFVPELRDRSDEVGQLPYRLHDLCRYLLWDSEVGAAGNMTAETRPVPPRPINALTRQDRLLAALTYNTHSRASFVARTLEAMRSEEDFTRLAQEAWKARHFWNFLYSFRIAAHCARDPTEGPGESGALRGWRRWLIELAEADDLFGSGVGARRRHRLIAQCYIGLFPRSEGRTIFPETERAALAEAIAAGRVVLAFHVESELGWLASIQAPRPTMSTPNRPRRLWTRVGRSYETRSSTGRVRGRPKVSSSALCATPTKSSRLSARRFPRMRSRPRSGRKSRTMPPSIISCFSASPTSPSDQQRARCWGSWAIATKRC